MSTGTDHIYNRSRVSFTRLYSTGTTSIVRTSIIMPPKTGIAIGIIMSEPRPVEVSTGSR